MRRDPVVAFLGTAAVAIGAILIVLVWPQDLLPSCSDPPHLGPGQTLLDYYDCTDHPTGDAVRAFLPVGAASLLVAVGFAGTAYGVRKHPRAPSNRTAGAAPPGTPPAR